jgi:orotate phosphoribosyltransferase/AMMECR1 domain-containing protein
VKRHDGVGGVPVMEAWSDSLARLPAAFHADRAELVGLLRKDGILYRSPTQPILSRDGSSARWMLNSLQVTLTPRGAELAGRCVLELLKRFEGRQIATLGLTAVPILNSCILQSGGRYHGLLVRQQRKKHGSLKLIEGPVDRDEPVILIDDSISSGTSMQLACETLEDAGLRVEGGIALVRFGWHGGYARMQEQGYHVEAVSDIWSDFIYHMEDEPRPFGNPTKVFPEFQWSTRCAPEKLHPAELARLMLREYLASGTLLRPPRELDADYPAAGGVWVSLRSSKDIHTRHARDGFWHFPGEDAWRAGEGIAWAALKTAAALPAEQALDLLDDSAIAITFFTALEPCTVGELDNDRYGIVVRSLERPGWMGGGLPRMPGILNEWDQYQHARMTNAQLISFEPHVIYRHEVIKIAEPGVTWQPTGVPKPEEPVPIARAGLGGLVATRARDLVLKRLFGREPCTAPLADDLLPADVDSLQVSIYLGGRLRGCNGSAPHRLDEAVARLVDATLQDERFDAPGNVDSPDAVAVSVAFLHDRLDLGVHSVEDVIRRIRYGQHALMVEQDNRFALFLPSVASRYNLPAIAFVEELLQKAGIVTPPYRWTRYECTNWLCDRAGSRLLEGSFAPESPPADLSGLVQQLGALGVGYLLRHQQDDGTFLTRYDPFQDQFHAGVDLPRLAHAAWVLARAKAFGAAAGDAVVRTLEFLVATLREMPDGVWLAHEDDERSVAEISLLVLALCEAAPPPLHEVWVPRLATTLWARIDPHGRVHTHQDAGRASDAFQDYYPGQVLLALAGAVRAGLTSIDDAKLMRAFRYYRHRFRARPRFGQVSWLTQACHAWWEVKRDPCFAQLAFEIAEWILGFQQRKTGAFLNDHQSDTPGYTTALYIEGVGAAAHLAASTGEEARHRRYLESCRSGLQFLDSLVIQPRDSPLLPNPAMAIGGLRRSARCSEIYVDFVQHYLAAVLGTHIALQAGEACSGQSAPATD